MKIISSSFLLAALFALISMLIYLVVHLIAGVSSLNFTELILVLIIAFPFFLAILEFFVFRSLKSQSESKIKEIQKLKEMEAFRREFLGDVSHELKTPIFAIEGFIETLLDGALEDENVNRKFLTKARKNAERLSNLVQDILVISQIESGELGMNQENFKIFELIMEVLDSLAYKFIKRERDIRYKFITNGLKNALVYADKQRIEQVLRNLVDNAVKYGDPKGTVSIILEEYGDDKLLIKVRDEGVGIDPDHLPRLFERFYRVDKSRSRERGGTGLGLAICKHLIEAHGEKIWVESTLGKGSVFQFTLQKSK